MRRQLQFPQKIPFSFSFNLSVVYVPLWFTFHLILVTNYWALSKSLNLCFFLIPSFPKAQPHDYADKILSSFLVLFSFWLQIHWILLINLISGWRVAKLTTWIEIDKYNTSETFEMVKNTTSFGKLNHWECLYLLGFEFLEGRHVNTWLLLLLTHCVAERRIGQW